MESNISGLSMTALLNIYKNGYSIGEIWKIILNNWKPSRNFTQKSKLYEYSSKMQITLPLSHFESYYQKVSSFLKNKQKLYLEGIKILTEKKCKISFIELPFHQKLNEIENNSPLKPLTEEFKERAMSYFLEFDIDSIRLNKSKNVFKDLSHLNCLGAKEISEQIALKINMHKNATLYIAY